MNIKKWSIDRDHSEIGFRVRHMMMTNVYGRFLSFDGDCEIDEDNFENSFFQLKIDVDSINTGNENRDKHLLSSDFFDYNRYPKIEFGSTSISKIRDGVYKVIGNLSICENVKSIEIEIEYDGNSLVDPFGQTKRGLSGVAVINREDWGLSWNSALEAGGFLVGKEVSLNFEIQIIDKN